MAAVAVGALLGAMEYLYTVVGNTRANRWQCQRISQRVQVVIQPILQLQESQLSRPQVIAAINDLVRVIKECAAHCEQYGERGWASRVFHNYSDRQKFDQLNEALSTSIQALNLGLSIQQLFDKRDDKADEAKDRSDLMGKADQILREMQANNEDQKSRDTDMMNYIKYRFDAMALELQSALKEQAQLLTAQAQALQLTGSTAPAETYGKDENEPVPVLDASGRRVQQIATGDEPAADAVVGATGTDGKDPARLPEAKFHPIPFNDLSFETKIGSGQFGDVFRGTWISRHDTVAIKLLKCGRLDGEELQLFKLELATIQNLRAPNVLCMLGACMQDTKNAVVMEHMSGGNLHDLLLSDKPLSWPDRWRIALDCCKGLNYLHQSAILHSDIRSKSFLLDSSVTVKLGVPLTSAEVKARANGTSVFPAWTAPEMLEGSEAYSPQCDIFSLGVVLWTIAVRKEPWGTVQPDVIAKAVKSGKRLAIPPDAPVEFAELVNACMAQDPKARPTAFALVAKIKAHLASMGSVEGKMSTRPVSPLAVAAKGPAGGSTGTTPTAMPEAKRPVSGASVPPPLSSSSDSTRRPSTSSSSSSFVVPSPRLTPAQHPSGPPPFPFQPLQSDPLASPSALKSYAFSSPQSSDSDVSLSRYDSSSGLYPPQLSSTGSHSPHHARTQSPYHLLPSPQTRPPAHHSQPYAPQPRSNTVAPAYGTMAGRSASPSHGPPQFPRAAGQHRPSFSSAEGSRVVLHSPQDHARRHTFSAPPFNHTEPRPPSYPPPPDLANLLLSASALTTPARQSTSARPAAHAKRPGHTPTGSQEGPPPYPGESKAGNAQIVWSARERESMLLFDTTASMCFPCADKTLMQRRDLVLEAMVPTIRDLEKAQEPERMGAGPNGPRSAVRGVRAVSCSDEKAEDLGYLTTNNVRSIWQRLKFRGGSYLMPGWQKLWSIFTTVFRDRKEKPMLMVLIVTDSLAEDSAEFERAVRAAGDGVSAIIAIVGYGSSVEDAVAAYGAMASRNPRLQVISFAKDSDPAQVSATLLQISKYI